MHHITLSTPIGTLKITSSGTAIVRVSTSTKKEVPRKHALICQLIRELEEYFSGVRQSFSVLLEYEGTPFQCSVWSAIHKIPYGETRTYQEIATSVGRPRAVRAVGTACGKNPLILIIPCHRVIGTRGLGGYALGLKAKKFLLNLERNT